MLETNTVVKQEQSSVVSHVSEGGESIEISLIIPYCEEKCKCIRFVIEAREATIFHIVLWVMPVLI